MKTLFSLILLSLNFSAFASEEVIIKCQYTKKLFVTIASIDGQTKFSRQDGAYTPVNEAFIINKEEIAQADMLADIAANLGFDINEVTKVEGFDLIDTRTEMMGLYRFMKNESQLGAAVVTMDGMFRCRK